MSAGAVGRRIWRYFKRYRDDGLSPPVLGELPYGDPASGRHHPENREIWDWSDEIDAASASAQQSADRAERAAEEAEAALEDAVAQGNVPIYNSRSALTGYEIPVGITALRVNGYSAVGDGGSRSMSASERSRATPARCRTRPGRGGSSPRRG